MVNIKKFYYQIGHCLFVFALGFLHCSELNIYAHSDDISIPEHKASRELFEQAIDQVHRNYYTKVLDEQLYEGAIRGMIATLDSYSTYLSPKEYSEMKKSTEGEFSGIGVDIMPPDSHGMIKIISPYEGGPAFRAGIKAGDVIIEINGVEVSDIDPAAIIDRLRGNVGSRVQIKVVRDGNKILNFNVGREIIKIIPVQIKLLPNSKTVYIRVRVFNGLTAKMIRKEYANLLNKLVSQKNAVKPDSVIIDLRWNPGGLLEQSVAVAELFIDGSREIVSIHGRDKEENNTQKYLTNSSEDITGGLPMVVMINNGTASAAEIVAAALHDNGRAILVGEKTFGKASVQTIIPIANGGAIKLSTATYYTPSGKMIHGAGIDPNVYVSPEGIISENALSNNEGKAIEANDEQQLVKSSIDRKRENADLTTKSIVDDLQVAKAFEILQTMLFYKNRFIRGSTSEDKVRNTNILNNNVSSGDSAVRAGAK